MTIEPHLQALPGNEGKDDLQLEQSFLGQVFLLVIGGVAGGLLGRLASSALWLLPLAALPWLGFAATQIFC